MRGISRSARSRFIAQMHGSKVKVSSNNPDYSGDLKATENSINSNLSFTKSSKSPTSLYASYISGDIFINRLEDSTQSSGAASEILWERMVGDKTMLGYFIGGSLGLSNDPGTLSSDPGRLAPLTSSSPTTSRDAPNRVLNAEHGASACQQARIKASRHLSG